MSLVKSISFIPLAYPEPHDHNRTRHLTLARIETSDGLVGWGEAITMFPEASLAVRAIGEQGLAPLLIGEPALDVERLWYTMLAHVWWYGPQGAAAMAISALDTALWDLKGKSLGLPLCRIAGAKMADRIQVMASIHFNMDDLDWNFREFTWFRDQGYRTMKGGWGKRPGQVFGENRKRDLELARGLREIAGEDRELVFDILGARVRWDVPEAIQRLRELEPLRPLWIEEPLPPQDYSGNARLRAAVSIAIGTGEQEWNLEGYRRLIAAGAADVIQVDPGRCLGYTGCLKVAALVQAHHLKFSTHTWSSAINTGVGVHLLAGFPCGIAMDFKPHESPMQHELVTDPWTQNDGFLEVRDAPGIGITVREETVQKFAWT